MDAVEDIKQRLSIEDVIGEYVELKRAGRNWKGLSPFGSERTASFMVSPEKQIWHDFSSGKGGNMFSFVMEMEGVDFRGALELLARKAGIDLDQYQHSGQKGAAKEKERLYELLDLATKFYQTQLKNNHEALEYVLRKRVLSKETVLEWRIGYSPNGGTALCTFLRAKGFSEQQIKAAGLSAQRYRGVGDMFRGRVMIPLADAQGRVIGFTARLLGADANAPKYINTPQTVLYDKSRHVFGLHLAKTAIREHKYAVVTEGQLDVVSSHQAGVKQVVATAGTALTEYHLKALSRFTDDIRLSFDADAAGLNATERAIPIASKANVSLSIVTIPSGKDPDELVKQDVSLWQQAIEHPQYAVDWLVERYAKQIDIQSAQGKRQFSDKLVPVIQGLVDPVEQEHYLQHVASMIGVGREVLALKVGRQTARHAPLKKPKVAFTPPDKNHLDYLKTQNHLLAVTLMQPELRGILEPITPDMMQDTNARQLLAWLQTNKATIVSSTEVEELRPVADYVKILAFHYEALYQTVDTHELEYEVTHVRDKLINRYVKIQKQRIAQELIAANDEEQSTLLNQVKTFDNLLKLYKGG